MLTCEEWKLDKRLVAHLMMSVLEWSLRWFLFLIVLNINVPNSQDPQIQYTIEYQNDHKEENFLDVTKKNNLNQSDDFAVYHKPAITNVLIKPYSNICPNIAMGGFKGFLLRALYIFSENYLAQEIEFLINVFVENGHSITVLEKVVKEYMNNITSVKEKVNIEIIKNSKIVKLP